MDRHAREAPTIKIRGTNASIYNRKPSELARSVPTAPLPALVSASMSNGEIAHGLDHLTTDQRRRRERSHDGVQSQRRGRGFRHAKNCVEEAANTAEQTIEEWSTSSHAHANVGAIAAWTNHEDRSSDQDSDVPDDWKDSFTLPLVRGDWVVSEKANCHIACDPYWFVSKTPADGGVVANRSGTVSLRVEAVGTVKIPVRVRVFDEGSIRARQRHQIITLHNVLLVPECALNVLSGPALAQTAEPWITREGQRRLYHTGLFNSSDGKMVLDRRPKCSEYRALVSGPPRGPYLKHSWFSVHPNAKALSATLSEHDRDLIMGRPFEDAEKAFVKAVWGDDDGLMRSLGMDGSVEEECIQARVAVRAAMPGGVFEV